jgi:ribosomal-protein-alanine N-acetyltransferase
MRSGSGTSGARRTGRCAAGSDGHAVTSGEVGLRDFFPQDLDAAYRLDRQCFEPGIAYTRGQLRDFLGREGAVALAAGPGDGTLVAFAIGHAAGARGHVVTIDIAPGERRRGLGRRLLSELMRRLADAGARQVRLEVDPRNDSAVRFYERMGFRVTRTLPDYYGPGRDGLRMTRELGPARSGSRRGPSSSP